MRWYSMIRRIMHQFYVIFEYIWKKTFKNTFIYTPLCKSPDKYIWSTIV